MASIQKRLSRKWKGRKWIDTPFARSYKFQRAIIRAQQIMAITHGVSRNSMIAASRDRPGITKAVFMAENTIKTAQAAVEIGRQITDIPGPYHPNG